MFRRIGLVVSVVALAAMASVVLAVGDGPGYGLDRAQVNTPTPGGDIGSIQQSLSAGTMVQAGEYDAVGTVPGCTATLITNTLVLTAAHCVCPSDDSTVGCNTRTTFTLHDVYPVDNPSTAANESQTRQDVSIGGTVRVHPEFGQRGWLREDLAVVTLDQPVTQVALSVVPIAVEEPQNTPMPGDRLTLIGYGVSGSGCSQPSVGKQKLTLDVTASNFAGLLFRYDGQDSCPGDSGGPVINAAGRVVGVASWGNFSSESTYRPTSFSYNWIFDLSNPGWGSCAWYPVEQQGINSHQPGPAWCPNGSFIVALDLDGDRSLSGHDAPVIGQAQCCNLAGAGSAGWEACSWYQVGQRGINSHQPGVAWCPTGSFITAIDLDGDRSVSASDAPVIGQVQCCRLSGAQYARWGSSYWIGVETMGINSHQAGPAWCTNGAFLTQLDLDSDGRLDDHDSPVVGQVKCSRPRPG